MSGMSAVDAALRRYPTWWQDRYGTEVRSLTADLAAEGRSPRRLAVDLVRGAIRVRAQAEGMPKRFGLWATRTRLSIALATLPWMVAVPLVLIAMGSQRLHATGGMVVHSGITPAGSHLHLLPTGGAFIPAHGTFPPSAPPLTMAGSMAAYAAFAMIPLLIITLVVLATGWGRLIGAIRTSCSPQRAKVTVLAWTPGFALLADIGLIAAQIAVRPSRFGGGMNGRPSSRSTATQRPPMRLASSSRSWPSPGGWSPSPASRLWQRMRTLPQPTFDSAGPSPSSSPRSSPCSRALTRRGESG